MGHVTTPDSAPTAVDALLDFSARIPDLLHRVLDDLDPDHLVRRPDVDGTRGNSIGWIAWHIGRMEDVQVAALTETDQVHASGGWQERLGVPYPTASHGYGMTEQDVARFEAASAAVLGDYYDAVHARTVEVLRGLGAQDLARVVDERWDPPVTALVRLVSVIDDAAQHVGQAAYLKGLLTG